jgi:hypothetical protein
MKKRIQIQMQLFQTIRNTLEIIAKSYFCGVVGSWVQILSRVINIFFLWKTSKYEPHNSLQIYHARQ